jgi:CBS domain-containing protein
MVALRSAGRDAPIGAHFRRGCGTADPDEPLEPVLARLQNEPCRTLPVLERESLVGLVTMENVGELLLVQASEQARRPAGRPSTPVSPG